MTCNPREHVHLTVPQHALQLSVYWCEWCRQHRLVAYTTVYGPEESSDASDVLEVEFGPFDAWPDVLQVALDWLSARALPAVPGSELAGVD